MTHLISVCLGGSIGFFIASWWFASRTLASVGELDAERDALNAEWVALREAQRDHYDECVALVMEREKSRSWGRKTAGMA